MRLQKGRRLDARLAVGALCWLGLAAVVACTAAAIWCGDWRWLETAGIIGLADAITAAVVLAE